MRAIIAVVVGAVALGTAVAGNARPGARRSTVVDRTFVCSTLGTGGAHAFRPDVSNVYSPPTTLVSADRRGGIFVDRQLCTPTTIRIPLAPKGLPGPPLVFGGVNCVLPGRIVVRIRLVYEGRRFLAGSTAVRLYRKRIPISFGTTRSAGTTDRFGNERFTRRLWYSHRCYEENL